jgi:mRNA interferase RelE/StbE
LKRPFSALNVTEGGASYPYAQAGDPVSSALQIYYADFDSVFFKLPAALRARIQDKIDEMGSRLNSFPHERLKGPTGTGLRVGDYRIIYGFDIEQNTIHLLAPGHRREIYRR